MNRLTLIAAATALVATPVFAQSTTETAVEILNESADGESEIIEGAEPVEGTGNEDCMDPAAEVVNASEDSEAEMIECTSVVSGEPEAGAEIFEELEEADDTN